MVSKEEIKKKLSEMECHFVQKSELQEELQNMLETNNKFEDGDDYGLPDYCMYFTNGENDATSHFCDIRVDYLKSRKRGTIFITGFEILHYYA